MKAANGICPPNLLIRLFQLSSFGLNRKFTQDMPAEAMVDAILNDAMAFERINLTVSRRRPFTAFEGKLWG